MARIAGVNVPTNKRVLVALTYVHGIGLTSSKNICKKVGIDEDKRINNLSEDELTKIRDLLIYKEMLYRGHHQVLWVLKDLENPLHMQHSLQQKMLERKHQSMV